ncbi:unnamed protein product [Musa acuminata var. zebrina]
MTPMTSTSPPFSIAVSTPRRWTPLSAFWLSSPRAPTSPTTTRRSSRTWRRSRWRSRNSCICTYFIAPKSMLALPLCPAVLENLAWVFQEITFRRDRFL